MPAQGHGRVLMSGLKRAAAGAPVLPPWSDCEHVHCLRSQLENAHVELVKMREMAAEVADAEARAALLLAEVEDAKRRLEEKNRAVESQARALADAIERGKAADLAKNTFLANISHEIRTPLHGIIGTSELALETALTPEQFDYLTTIRSCSEFLLQLINDVLDFSKLQAEKLVLSPIPFDVRDTLVDCMRAVGAQSHKKGIELVCDVPDEVPPTLIGDPGRLRQVALNLLSNAVKFTSQGEVLMRAALHSRPSPDEVELHVSVRDTGIGIAAENHRRIFEPFMQADASISRTHGGTGLGLSICDQIVRLMGGTIWVESELGGGSEFHFTARFGVSEPEVRTPLWEDTLAGVRVLIAGQNAVSREVLGNALQRRGLEVLTTSGADAAIAAAKAAAQRGESFDFALIDGCDASTFNLPRCLRQTTACEHAHTILLTWASHSSLAETDARLMKPVKPADIFELMARLSARKPPVNDQKVRRPLRILLAEDNRVNQVVASRLLEKRGHAVQIAKDGLEALRLHASDEFDLILMDVQMPGMNGLEACGAIRKRECGSGRRTPIFALTAASTEEGFRACNEAGMDGCLVKPISEFQLLSIINSISQTLKC
jgi:signal transduction histidine kinase/CheY-like chemotaxis protein